MNLERIDIGSGVTSISSASFYNCIALNSIYITDIEAWCNIEFYFNPLSLAENFYLNNELVTLLVLPETLTIINAQAFLGCQTITSVIIPSSVKIIDHDAFYCPNLTNVYYQGSAQDWEKMKVGIMNQPLINAMRYYYSENLPEQEGNYWHFNEDGELKIWE